MMLRKFFKKARRVARDEQGITAVEYAVLGALVAGGLVVVVPSLLAAFTAAFAKIAGAIAGTP